MASQSPFAVRELKIRAALVHKSLDRDNTHACADVVHWFERCGFADSQMAVFRADPHTIRRKHILQALALEQGFTSWSDLRVAHELAARPVLDGERFLRGAAGFFNRWFAGYTAARASLRAYGGYLLPYRHQFFVCEAGLIAGNGLDPDDADWRRIGYDWVVPSDPRAKLRLAGALATRGLIQPGR